MAAASKQAQLRSLMKQKQSSTTESPAATSRVTHKLAHYTAKGDLVCLLCKVPIKSSTLWPAHCSSATHKQKLELLATKQREQNTQKDTSSLIDSEANEPSAKRAKLNEPTSSETHHTIGPTPDSESTNVLPPPNDEGPSNEEILKALRAEWEEQEATILESQKIGDSAVEETFIEDLGYEDNESDEDVDDYHGQSAEDDLLMAKHAEHRLSLLQGQKEAMMDRTLENDEESSNSEDSLSSEDVDMDDLYNWRSRAV